MGTTGQQQPTAMESSPSYLQTTTGELFFSVPETWQISTIASFTEPSSFPDCIRLAKEAFASPTDTRPLNQLLKKEDTVCILIEDLTRKSPKALILKELLAQLQALGIADDAISIIIALGTHRPLSREELSACFGEEIVARYNLVNHDCRNPELTTIGKLSSGTPVKINKLAAEADFCIGIGSIFPHPLNGFGGGGKIMFPGIADFDSIVEHHLRHSFRDMAYLGNMSGNSFYEEITALAKAGGLAFIINSVLDHHDRLHQIVAGDPVAAHHAGTEICRTIISKEFREKADVTIISAFPYSEGPQIMKPLAPATMTTKEGGWVILHANCSSPLPEDYFKACIKFRERHAGRVRQAVLEYFAENRLIFEGAPPEMNMSMGQVMLGINDFNVILVTTDIATEKVEQLGFHSASNMEEAIAFCAQHVRNPTVNIIPAGGVILPVLP